MTFSVALVKRTSVVTNDHAEYDNGQNSISAKCDTVKTRSLDISAHAQSDLSFGLA